MVIVTQRGKPFVYGQFIWPKKRFELLQGLAAPPGWEDVAIEILREFSPTDLIGKLYYMSPHGTWAQMDLGRASQHGWYNWFSKTKKSLYFYMDGSGAWQVIHFRNESDESGPYVAVALQFSPQPPPWVAKQR